MDVAQSTTQVLTTMRALVTCSFNFEYTREKVVSVLRVRPTPTGFPTNISYTPMTNIRNAGLTLRA